MAGRRSKPSVPMTPRASSKEKKRVVVERYSKTKKPISEPKRLENWKTVQKIPAFRPRLVSLDILVRYAPANQDKEENERRAGEP